MDFWFYMVIEETTTISCDLDRSTALHCHSWQQPEEFGYQVSLPALNVFKFLHLTQRIELYIECKNAREIYTAMER